MAAITSIVQARTERANKPLAGTVSLVTGARVGLVPRSLAILRAADHMWSSATAAGPWFDGKRWRWNKRLAL